MADEGILFENAYCTQANCSPSRASLYTGLYPHQNGHMGLAKVGGFYLRKGLSNYLDSIGICYIEAKKVFLFDSDPLLT